MKTTELIGKPLEHERKPIENCGGPGPPSRHTMLCQICPAAAGKLSGGLRFTQVGPKQVDSTRVHGFWGDAMCKDMGALVECTWVRGENCVQVEAFSFVGLFFFGFGSPRTPDVFLAWDCPWGTL